MNTASLDDIFQNDPPDSRPSLYRAKSWTETTEGYIQEAKKLTTCILKNRKMRGRGYTWFLTIFFRDVMTAADSAAVWTKACRNLRRLGIVALWVREPTRTNRIHYHLILSSDHTKKAMAEIIERSLPPRKEVGWHKNLKPAEDDWQLSHYLTKAKIESGNIRDRYASKRLLFKAGLGLRKHGTIGKFWMKPTKELWREVQETEARIAEGLADERIRRLAIYVHEFIGGCVTLKDIERRLAYRREDSLTGWPDIAWKLSAADNTGV